MVKLGVNIDHVATVRQARKATEPSVLQAAITAVQAGADGITIHLREDRRHIQDQDVWDIQKSVPKLNLEMAATLQMIQIACQVNPACVCLVPEKRQELTTEGGLDVVSDLSTIEAAVSQLKVAGIEVSIFIDPVESQIAAAYACGAVAIELHTGTYANATGSGIQYELDRLKTATAIAIKMGLVVNAGHGLNYQNVQKIVEIPGISELNIGHSIVSQSIFVGLSRAVADMKALLS